MASTNYELENALEAFINGAGINEFPANDNWAALDKLCRVFHKSTDYFPPASRVKKEVLVKTYALFAALLHQRGIQNDEATVYFLNNWSTITQSFESLDKAIGNLHEAALGNRGYGLIADEMSRFEGVFSNGGVEFYEVSENELNHIQQLINNLRDLITTNMDILPEHKQRLLKRLEAFQAELQKGKTNFDKFWILFIQVEMMASKYPDKMVSILKETKELLETITKIVFTAEGIKKLIGMGGGDGPKLLS